MGWNFASELDQWGPQSPPTAVGGRFAKAYCSHVARSHYENFTVVSLLLPRNDYAERGALDAPNNMRRIVNVNNIKLSEATLRSEKVVLRSEFLATTFRFLDQSASTGDAKKK